MNVVVTQTAINASVSDLNVSASVISTPVSVTVSSGLLDAPSNGLTYGRNNGAWVSITGTGGGGSSLPVADTQTIVMGSVDPTKLLRFEVDGFTAGATRVLTPPNQDILLAGQNFLNVFTVNQQMDAHLAVGANSDVNNPGALLYPQYTTKAFLSVEEEFSLSQVGIDYVVGTLSQMLVNPSDSSPDTYYIGADIEILTKSTNGNETLGLAGIYGSATNQGSGDMLRLVGLEYYAVNEGNGDIEVIYGISSSAWHYGTGQVTELIGIYADCDIDGPTTTAYGIYVKTITGATTSYAIYTNGGNVSLGGNLFLRTIKSGATQVAAGAAAGEVWKTNGHATLPNNVLMIGV